MRLDKEIVNKLKVNFYEQWTPEDHRYMKLEFNTGAVCFTNDLDCDGNMYWNYKTFLKCIAKLD